MPKYYEELILINFTVHFEEIFFGVPQGLLLGTTILNIWHIDIFLVIKNVKFACYAHDNATYQSVNKEDDVINDVQLFAEINFHQFNENQLKENRDNLNVIWLWAQIMAKKSK